MAGGNVGKNAQKCAVESVTIPIVGQNGSHSGAGEGEGGHVRGCQVAGECDCVDQLGREARQERHESRVKRSMWREKSVLKLERKVELGKIRLEMEMHDGWS